MLSDSEPTPASIRSMLFAKWPRSVRPRPRAGAVSAGNLGITGGGQLAGSRDPAEKTRLLSASNMFNAARRGRCCGSRDDAEDLRAHAISTAFYLGGPDQGEPRLFHIYRRQLHLVLHHFPTFRSASPNTANHHRPRDFPQQRQAKPSSAHWFPWCHHALESPSGRWIWRSSNATIQALGAHQHRRGR